MNELLQAATLANEILKAANTSDKAAAIISKWRVNRDGTRRDLGPNPIATAAALEARNQVFGWGR
jgi:hypothetical protein